MGHVGSSNPQWFSVVFPTSSTRNTLKINLPLDIREGNIIIHWGSLSVFCCQQGFCLRCIMSLLSHRVGLANFQWCMTIPDRTKVGARPANGSVVSGCGCVCSWLGLVGSVTVYTPDTQSQGRGSKIHLCCPVLRISYREWCDCWQAGHVGTHT